MSDTIIYNFDEAEQEKLSDDRPWKDVPTYFQKVQISLSAVLKMLLHGNMGADLQPVEEIGGFGRGKLSGNTFVVTDTFECPGVASSTSVEFSTDTNINYTAPKQDILNKKMNNLGRSNAWYHSHPGLGIFMSNIDTNTLRGISMHSTPYVALVIDPIKTRNLN